MSTQVRPPKFFWSVEYLSELENELGDECKILCLSPISFRLLADMSRMLLWGTRYDVGYVPELARIAYREMNIPCNDSLQSVFQTILDEIEELKDMEINVQNKQTVNCGGGCSGGVPTNVTTIVNGEEYTVEDLESITEFEDNGVDSPDGFETREEYDEYKCQLAGQLTQDWIDSLDSLTIIGAVAGTGSIAALTAMFIGEAAAGYGIASGLLAGLIGVGVSATAGVVILLGVFITAAIAGFTAANYFEELAEELRARKQEIVCRLYNSSTAAEARAVLVDVTNESVAIVVAEDVQQGGIFTNLVEGIVDVLIPEELPKILFSASRSLVSGAQVYDCTGCGSQSDGFYLIDFDNNNPAVTENLFGDTFVVTDDYSGNLTIKCVVDSSGNPGGGSWNKGAIQTEAGITGNFQVDRVEFDVRNRDFDTNDDPLKMWVGNNSLEHDFDVAALNSSTYTHFDFTVPEPVMLTDSQDIVIRFYAYSNGPRESYLIDNIKIYYTEEVLT